MTAVTVAAVTVAGATGSTATLVDSPGEQNGVVGEVPPKARIHHWSTDAARTHERFAYWREAICQAVFNISIESGPQRFDARITSRSSGPFRFATTQSSGSQSVRSRQDIASAPADHYSIYLQRSGHTLIDQGDESFTFHADDIAISDGQQPFRAALSDGGRRTIAVIPRELIDRRAPWLGRQPLRKLASHSPFVDLARRHLLMLADDDAKLSGAATSLLTDNLCNLLALASTADAEPDRLQPELQIEALLAFCRQHLQDAELTPHVVAAHCGISVRTLHLRFKQIGQ